MTRDLARLTTTPADRYRIERAGGGIAASSHIAAIRTLGATLVLAAVLAVWGWLRPVPSPSVSSYTLAMSDVADDLLGPEHTAYAPWAVAPDGRFLMARRVRGEQQTLPSIVLTENFLEELKVKVPR